MAIFDKTIPDFYTNMMSTLPARTPTVIVEDPRNQKIAIMDMIAFGNTSFTGHTFGFPDFRYTVYNNSLIPLSKAANNFLNRFAGYSGHNGNYFFQNYMPVQMLFGNTTMACGLLCNTSTDGLFSGTGDYIGYMHNLNNWNRSIVRERPAFKHFYEPSVQESWMSFPISSTSRTTALEIDINTYTIKFSNAAANNIIGGTGANVLTGSNLTTTPWWSTHSPDFFEYDSTNNRLVGVSVRNGSALNSTASKKVQPGGGGFVLITTPFTGTAALVAIANSTNGRAANSFGVEDNPSLTFVGPRRTGTSQYLYINSRMASHSAGLLDVSTNTFSNATSFTITTSTNNKWPGTPSMVYQRSGDSSSVWRYVMSELQDANAGRRMREYVATFTNATTVAQGNAVLFANTNGWETPTGTTGFADTSGFFGYLATVTTYVPGGSTSEYFFTQIPVENLQRPSLLLTNNNMVRWATCYLTNTGDGLVALSNTNSYSPTEPPIAVYPIDVNQQRLVVLYNTFAEFMSINTTTGVWSKTATYSFPLRTITEDTAGRVWAYDTAGRIHLIYPSNALTSAFVLQNTSYSYTGSLINTWGNLDAYDVTGARVVANVQVTLTGGGLRFSDNTVVKTITTSSSASTNVALQVIGPGSTSIRLYV